MINKQITVTVFCSSASLSMVGREMSANLNDVEIKDLLDNIAPDDIVDYFTTEQLLERIDRDEALAYFNATEEELNKTIKIENHE